jgi:hypothetical protein
MLRYGITVCKIEHVMDILTDNEDIPLGIAT